MKFLLKAGILVMCLVNSGLLACKKPLYQQNREGEQQLNDFYDHLLEDEDCSNFATRCEEKKYDNKSSKNMILKNEKSSKEVKKRLSDTQARRIGILMRQMQGINEVQNAN